MHRDPSTLQATGECKEEGIWTQDKGSGQVEYAVFTPLVFSTTGGQGKETTIAYKRLAELFATKRKIRIQHHSCMDAM